jgi:hypothetical protein
MMKSAETAASNFKETAKSSISSIKQTHETAMESTLSLIKKKATEIVTTVLSDLGFNSNSVEDVIHATIVSDSSIENEKKKFSSKKLALQSSTSKKYFDVKHQLLKDTSSTEKIMEKAMDEKVLTCISALEVNRPTESIATQPTTIVSPFVADKKKQSRDKKLHLSTIPLTTNFTPRSCVTPCAKVSVHRGGQLLDDVLTSPKKRPIPVKSLPAKRPRRRYGHSRALYGIDEMECSLQLS